MISRSAVETLELQPSPPTRIIRRRTRRDPLPRFVTDRSHQLDGVHGCPQGQVGPKHLARVVEAEVAKLDLSAVESTYSSLGRHGFSPRSMLALWVYASAIGVHHASKLSRMLETDAACRLLTGGHRISRSKLSEFRAQHGGLFAAALEQTVALAAAAGYLQLDELAIDSMRLRANASTTAVRTIKRSTDRLAELDKIDPARLDDEARDLQAQKVAKHRAALKMCEEQKAASVVLTNPSASLMKFPTGGGQPGHRVSITAAGVTERLVVAVLIDADTNDYGKLGPLLDLTRDALTKAGVDADAPLQVAADAGYTSGEDLIAAAEARVRGIDVLVAGADGSESRGRNGYFGRDRFEIRDDGSVICPAGTLMKGSSGGKTGRFFHRGDGCATCSLRPQCTTSIVRTITLDPELEKARRAMLERMAEPGASERYGQRIATVEPVFSNIEDTMSFRRSSTRHPVASKAEILLKILTHNLLRLAAARRLRLVYLTVNVFPATL